MLQCVRRLASVAKFAAFALLAQGLLTTGVGAIEPIRIGSMAPAPVASRHCAKSTNAANLATDAKLCMH